MIPHFANCSGVRYYSKNGNLSNKIDLFKEQGHAHARPRDYNVKLFLL